MVSCHVMDAHAFMAWHDTVYLLALIIYMLPSTSTLYPVMIPATLYPLPSVMTFKFYILQKMICLTH